MISAPNRLQQLSGSKWWPVLLLLLLVGACSSQKNTSGAPKGYEVIDTKPSQGNQPKKEAPYQAPNTNGTKPNKVKNNQKPFYNVALVLPFYLDSFPTASGGIYPQSRIGVEYYQGVLSALDTLKTQGLNIKLHVFDSYPETYLDVLIKGSKLSTMDLIIGPVFNSSMKLMAKYALEARIPVWSPFSPAGDITAQNQFFYIANPRTETHAQEMIRYTTDNFKNANILVLYQNNAQEKTYLEIYRKHLQSLNLKAKEKLIENSGSGLPRISTGEIGALLEERPNVVVVPSMSVPFILNLLREVYPLANKYDITLMGTPSMGNDVDLQLNYVNALNAHFTQTYFLKPGYYESSFYVNYLNKYANVPSEYAVNGYDQMMFLGTAMSTYGETFRMELEKLSYTGWGSSFNMGPAILQPNPAEGTPIDYWDNKHTYILRYNDYVLERAR